jgi:histidinol dehydrogenase
MIELIDVRDDHGLVRIERPAHHLSDLEPIARAVVEDVRLRGDTAVLEYASKFDGDHTADTLRVDPNHIVASQQLVRPDLIDALNALVARCQDDCKQSLLPEGSQTSNGTMVGELVRPLRKVGVYARRRPAGRLTSLVTSVVPAQVAGVEGIAVCAAPNRSGQIPDSVLAACSVAGVDEVYRIGGAQAIAALAYGTETVRPVDKVVGAGGPFVTAAQRLVRGWVGTGPSSGPAELLVIADESASAGSVADELVANAAAGAGGSHVLLTWVPELLDEVGDALDVAVGSRDGSGDLENALIEGGRGILVRDLDQALEAANVFAPARLLLCVAGAEGALARIRNAGSVLLGDNSPAATAPICGPPGLVPTGGTARWDSGLSPRDFVKTITVCNPRQSRIDGAAESIRVIESAEAPEIGSIENDVRLS